MSSFPSSLFPASANLRTTTVKHVSRSFTRDGVCHTLGNALGKRAGCILATMGLLFQSRKPMKEIRLVRLLCTADGSSEVATNSVRRESENIEAALTENQSVTAKSMPLMSATGNVQSDVGVRDDTSQMKIDTTDGLQSGSEGKREQISSSIVQSPPKRSPLTAREKLRAARVLTRYTETKSPKRERGRNVLDALRESDKGKIPGLPEAPTNLFDDSKRGMPKKGLTFDFPGGFDLFLIIFSFVFISTVMFATTYIVWKAGAIHFNEY